MRQQLEFFGQKLMFSRNVQIYKAAQQMLAYVLRESFRFIFIASIRYRLITDRLVVEVV